MVSPSDAPLHIGRVTLAVHDLERVGEFYQRVVGLEILSADRDSTQLGSGLNILLTLQRDRHAPARSPRDAGLFHTAFLLPSRADLGRWAKHAADQHLAVLGASDHGVSEAFYIADPEGNGIEIYADRPRQSWKRTATGIDMPSDPLNIDDLLENADNSPWRTAPEGTSIGHVHLQVGAIAPAEEFYSALLGFDVTHRYPGSSFFGSGGYHHHIATNIWNSRGAQERTAPTTGLTDVEIVTADAGVLAAVRDRMPENRLTSADASSLNLRDPWGTSITLKAF